MENADVFNENNNPFYPAFNPDEAAITKMTLVDQGIDFMSVPFTDLKGMKSVRFFVNDVDPDLRLSRNELRNKIANTPALMAQYKYESNQFEKYWF